MENIDKIKQGKPHNLTIEGRKKASLSGVENVINSTDTLLNVQTSDGTLSIFGKELKIEKYSTDEQTLVISGQIDSFKYEQTKAPLLKRLFK